MKTEAQYTSDVLRELRLLRPEWIVTKVNDRTTAGIPDAFCCRDDGSTLWVEFKRSLTARPNITTLLTPAQTLTLGKMLRLEVPHVVLIRCPDTWRAYDGRGFIRDLTPSAKETAAWLAQ